MEIKLDRLVVFLIALIIASALASHARVSPPGDQGVIAEFLWGARDVTPGFEFVDVRARIGGEAGFQGLGPSGG